MNASHARPEQSVAHADNVTAKLRRQIKNKDREINLVLRSQTENGQEINAEVEQVKKAMAVFPCCNSCLTYQRKW